MPKGMYLLFHDEIKGPAIKCSFFGTPIVLSQEFISKLYMSHAGFGTSSTLELKFEGFRNISLYTGHVARQDKKEGILGIIFEENEGFQNLELFLHHYLKMAVNYPDNQTMEFLFTKKLPPYLELNKIFKSVQVEQIPEIFIITGDREYRICLLHIGEGEKTNQKFSTLYKKILERSIPQQYQFIEIESSSDKHIFLVFKSKYSPEITKILTNLKPYVEVYFNYALEILALFLIPSEIKIMALTQTCSFNESEKSQSVLQFLKRSTYEVGFNKVLSSLIKAEIGFTSVNEAEPEVPLEY